MKNLLFSLIATITFMNLSQGQIKNEELEAFKKDKLTLLLKDNFYQYLKDLVKEDAKGMHKTTAEAKTIIENMNNKFGKEKLASYLNALDASGSSLPTDAGIYEICGTHDGNPCTLNQDGTTYWGACSFWEGVAAYAAILANCGAVDFSSSTSEWINYAKCNQKQICNHC